MPKKNKPPFNFSGFPGFGAPEFTAVPDIVFDEIMVYLSEAELRVLLYILRRTYGWKKDSDAIALSQITDGIKARDGRVIDLGAGVARAAAVRAVKGLSEKGLIVAERSAEAVKLNQPTTYRLHLRRERYPKRTAGSIPKINSVVSEGNPQDPTLQGYDPGIVWSNVLTSLRAQLPKTASGTLDNTTGDHWEGSTLIVLCEHQTQADHLSTRLGSRVNLVLGQIVEGATARFIATARLIR